jgi:hypothetical protein
LGFSAAEPTAAPREYAQNHHDQKNHQHGDHTSAAAASAIIVSHIEPPGEFD